MLSIERRTTLTNICKSLKKINNFNTVDQLQNKSNFIQDSSYMTKNSIKLGLININNSRHIPTSSDSVVKKPPNTLVNTVGNNTVNNNTVGNNRLINNLGNNTAGNSVVKNTAGNSVVKNTAGNTVGNNYAVKNNIAKSFTTNTRLENNFNIKSDYLREYDNPTFDFFPDFQNFIIVTKKEPILMAVCVLIYNDFIFMNDKKKDIFIKTLKYKMAIDMDKKNLYDKFNYKSIRFNKTKLQDSMIYNNDCDNDKFYTYLGDYFNINLVVLSRYIDYKNVFSKNRYSLIIANKDDKYIIHRNSTHSSLIINTESLHLENYYEKDYLIKLKLKDLQKIVETKGINIKKSGKNGLINKKKDELILDLQI